MAADPKTALMSAYEGAPAEVVEALKMYGVRVLKSRACTSGSGFMCGILSRIRTFIVEYRSLTRAVLESLVNLLQGHLLRFWSDFEHGCARTCVRIFTTQHTVRRCSLLFLNLQGRPLTGKYGGSASRIPEFIMNLCQSLLALHL